MRLVDLTPSYQIFANSSIITRTSLARTATSVAAFWYLRPFGVSPVCAQVMAWRSQAEKQQASWLACQTWHPPDSEHGVGVEDPPGNGGLSSISHHHRVT